MKTIRRTIQKGTILFPGGETLIRYPGNGRKFSLEEIQKYVGGYAEPIATTNSRKTMYVDEDSKRKNLLPNELAKKESLRGYMLLGPALLIESVPMPDVKELSEAESIQ